MLISDYFLFDCEVNKCQLCEVHTDFFFLFFSSSESTALDSPSQATVTQGVAGDTPPPGSEDSPMQSEEAAPADRGVSPMAQAPPSPSMRPAGNGRGSQPPPGATVITANLNDPKGTNRILRKHLL